MKKHQWNGYMLSEYEGPDKEKQGFVSDQLRRQHIMMQRMLKKSEGKEDVNA